MLQGEGRVVIDRKWLSNVIMEHKSGMPAPSVTQEVVLSW